MEAPMLFLVVLGLLIGVAGAELIRQFIKKVFVLRDE